MRHDYSDNPVVWTNENTVGFSCQFYVGKHTYTLMTGPLILQWNRSEVGGAFKATQIFRFVSQNIALQLIIRRDGALQTNTLSWAARNLSFYMFGPFFNEVKTHKQIEKHGGVDTVAVLLNHRVPWRWCRLIKPIFGCFLCFSLLCVLAGSIYGGRGFNLVVMSTKGDSFWALKGHKYTPETDALGLKYKRWIH